MDFDEWLDWLQNPYTGDESEDVERIIQAEVEAHEVEEEEAEKLKAMTTKDVEGVASSGDTNTVKCSNCAKNDFAGIGPVVRCNICFEVAPSNGNHQLW